MIAVTDIAYVRYRAPDLDKMESFLLDFGLHRAARTATTLYMRAAGAEPYVHVTELGDEPRGIGIGLLAQNDSDLSALAQQLGLAVEDNPEPRGGRRVTLADPDGVRIDVLAGGARLEPLAMPSTLSLNDAVHRTRLGTTQRRQAGPSHVLRLGHVVIKASNYQRSCDFYSQLFGFRVSDSYLAGGESRTIMSFLHCGLGERFTDHHTVAVGEIPGPPGFEHSAFEVLDWDDVAVGGQFLASKGHRHSWGIGRHILGSQIFDYWRDPFGNKVEHWTDGDLVNDAYVPSRMPLGPEALAQWAPPLNPEFFS